MEQLAPHEKVYVSKSWFANDPIHSGLGCEFCHGGDPDDDNWRTAHDGVYKDPSWENLDTSCGMCHAEIAKNFATSLHATLRPYEDVIRLRATPDTGKYETVNMARENHCTSCHASCGTCHISRPDEVEGGLLAGHSFVARPPMAETCTACHGSRIDREFFGKNEGMKPDVHQQRFMQCSDCHTADEMHGDGNEYENRYTVENGAQCVRCHESIYSEPTEYTAQHVIHRDLTSCQVCHSMPYKNCYSCHVGKDQNGLSYFKTEPSEMGFKIGLNPMQSDQRPERYVTVRHIPIDHGLFDYYLEDALSNFDLVPTWKMATPHTISRKTPQNESCNNCHGNRELFLQESDVRPEYLEANRNVVVPDMLVPAQRED